MYEAEFVFCILLIAAQRGDETLLLLLFYPARVPGWTFYTQSYTQHQSLYIVSVAAKYKQNNVTFQLYQSQLRHK